MQKYNRRDFIKTAGVIAGSLTLAACGVSPTQTNPDITPNPTSSSEIIETINTFDEITNPKYYKKQGNQAFRKNKAVGIQFHFEADINEIPKWCDAYDFELAEVGKTKEEVITSYQEKSDLIKSYNFQFLENFLSTI